jgi:hypothetical protein
VAAEEVHAGALVQHLRRHLHVDAVLGGDQQALDGRHAGRRTDHVVDHLHDLPGAERPDVKHEARHALQDRTRLGHVRLAAADAESQRALW